jgi:hypothetical protein
MRVNIKQNIVLAQEEPNNRLLCYTDRQAPTPPPTASQQWMMISLWAPPLSPRGDEVYFLFLLIWYVDWREIDHVNLMCD